MLENSPLGQTTIYIENYSPELLFPISRQMARSKIGITSSLPFAGSDQWIGYELSWLNLRGKPEIAIAEFSFPCHTPYLVESKSFKLYLNSFNQTPFESLSDVKKTLEKDLSEASQGQVRVCLNPLNEFKSSSIGSFSGYCLDGLDVEIDTYQVEKEFLKNSSHEIVQERLYSDLLKSNCLATGQPDWGSVEIHYQGPQIDYEGLLKYIISYRRHSGFAEHCAEQMFCDILTLCSPNKLSVHCRYTRRGGLEINPFRSNFETAPQNMKHSRQ